MPGTLSLDPAARARVAAKLGLAVEPVPAQQQTAALADGEAA